MSKGIEPAIDVMASYFAAKVVDEMMPRVKSVLDVYFDEMRLMAAFSPGQRVKIGELARHLECSTATIRRQVKSGKLPPGDGGKKSNLWWLRETLCEFEAKRRDDAFESGVFQPSQQAALEGEYREVMEAAGARGVAT